MKYDVHKIREIAGRLGVDEETVIQYLRCRSPQQPEEREAADERAVENVEPTSPAEAPTPKIMPGHLHG